jgi:hypothetical protein
MKQPNSVPTTFLECSGITLQIMVDVNDKIAKQQSDTNLIDFRFLKKVERFYRIKDHQMKSNQSCQMFSVIQQAQ